MWFLDVDGVIRSATPVVDATHRDVEVSFLGWPVNVSYQPQVIARINALHRAQLVDVRWLTT